MLILLTLTVILTSTFHIYLGMSFAQHEVLCNVEMNGINYQNEGIVRRQEANRICPYVDCNLDESIELCPQQCTGSKLMLLHYI